MLPTQIAEVERSWSVLAPMLFVPETEAEYTHLVNILNDLLDVVGQDETHSLASLVTLVGTLVEQYEQAHVPYLEDIFPGE